MKEIPRPLKFPRDIQTIGTGWVIQNLSKYDNSVLPSRLLEMMEDKTIIRLLEVITDEKIAIYQTKGGYIVERIQ